MLHRNGPGSGVLAHVCNLSCCSPRHLAKLQLARASCCGIHMGQAGPKLSLVAMQGRCIPMQGHQTFRH